MNTKNAQKHEKQTATPLGKNSELQILNKQHIKNEGIYLFSGCNMSVSCSFPYQSPKIYWHLLSILTILLSALLNLCDKWKKFYKLLSSQYCCVILCDSLPAGTNQSTEQGGVCECRSRASVCRLHLCTRHSTYSCHQLHWLTSTTACEWWSSCYRYSSLGRLKLWKTGILDARQGGELEGFAVIRMSPWKYFVAVLAYCWAKISQMSIFCLI